jgi:hypothetical protein
MKKRFILALLAVLFFISCQGKGDKPPLYGFIPDATNYEVIDIDGRSDVVKIQGKDCGWNVLSYSLNDFREQMIIIDFSVDVMRLGSDGKMNWVVNNLPFNPSIANIENAESGVWYNMSGTLTITPTNLNSVLFLDADYKQETDFYFDNLRVLIENIHVENPGENNTDGTRNIYVSTSKGSEKGNGTQASPFKKIAHAMYYVKPGDTVLLDSGTYYEIVTMPSGEEGKPVTLTAMPGAQVIITPTILITPEWKQHDGNIYVADISKYISQIDTDFLQLFADRDSMVEARYPNMGPSMSMMHDYKRDIAGRGTNKNTVVASRNIPANIVGARLVISPGVDGASWETAWSLVQSVNGRTIKLATDISHPDPLQHGSDPFTPSPGNPFYITGALALLDAPGEYYFDPQTNLLYFYPPWNGRPDMRTLTLRGKSDIAIQAENTSYVNIKNITVYGGAIFMKNTRNNTLENCSINYAEHFFIYGIHAYYSWKRADRMIVSGSNNRIERCEFGPTAGHGIVLSGDDHIFTNNIVHNTGYIGFFYPGIHVKRAKRLEISHNSIINSGYCHIIFNSTFDNAEKIYDFIYEKCIIRNNYMENHMTIASDGGAFATWGTDGGGTEVYNNFIVHGNNNNHGAFTKGHAGLYTDNYTSNYIIHHNIVIGGSTGLIINLWSRGVRFYNNTVIGASMGFLMYGYPGDNNPDASTSSFIDNLFVDTKNVDMWYGGTENGRPVDYYGNFVNGTIPAPVRLESRIQSSGNFRGTVDDLYRPTGNTPDIGAIPRGGLMFAYGANWTLED